MKRGLKIEVLAQPKLPISGDLLQMVLFDTHLLVVQWGPPECFFALMFDAHIMSRSKNIFTILSSFSLLEAL